MGNSAYRNGGGLKNPVNDVSAMAKVLDVLGFEVKKLTDCTQNEMRKAMDEFGLRMKNQEVGLFFYAGHGVQVGGKNYLVPVDCCRMDYPNQVDYNCVDVGRLLANMENAGAGTNIVILDACRDNPFRRSWSQGSQDKGLAFMNAPSGSFIAYATSPGRTAADGSGTNGLYTSALLKYIAAPGIKIEDVFKKGRIDVRRQSNGGQTPWESTSLQGDFYFAALGNRPAASAFTRPSGDVGHTPPKISGLGDKDAVIREREAARAEWSQWQSRMADGYARAQGYEKNNALTPSEKETVWQKFSTAWSAENPYSIEDETMRTRAKERILYWQAQSTVAMGSTPKKSSGDNRSWTEPVTGMEFVWVEGGCFQMGDTFGDGRSDEKTVHKVCVDGFWMERYEVTQAEYRKMMGENPSGFKGVRRPVESVSWDDAKKFISALNRRSSKTFALPTEVQWEYAARERGKKVRFGTGRNTIGPDEANFNAESEYKKSYSRSGVYRQKTMDVGSFSPNSLGLYDMAGNVWEWCEDACNLNAYSKHVQNNPVITKGSWFHGTIRRLRGGSWSDLPMRVRCAYHDGYIPSWRDRRGGFRLVVLPGHR